MKLNFTLFLGILLLIFSCEQKSNSKDTQPNFYKTDVSFSLNGISLNDTFNLEEYVSVLGNPDCIKKGGAEIINEFGFDDYNLWYGKDWLNAGHGYLLNAKIIDEKINFNGIYVGDDFQKINNTFKISAKQKDSIKIISKNEDVLLLIFKNKKIHTIHLWRPI